MPARTSPEQARFSPNSEMETTDDTDHADVRGFGQGREPPARFPAGCKHTSTNSLFIRVIRGFRGNGKTPV